MATETRDLDAITKRAIGAVKKLAPSAGVLATAYAERSSNVRFAVNEITSCGEVVESSARLTVTLGNRHASTSIDQTDDASIDRLAARAVDMAKLAPEDPESMPVLGPQTYDPQIPAWDERVASLSAESRAGMARVAIARGKSAGLVLAGYLENDAWESVYATSEGLRASYRDTHVELSMTARTKSAAGSGWSGRTSHAIDAIDADALARVACDKALLSEGAKPLDPGRYTVVLEPSAVGLLLGFLAGSLAMRSAEEGRSVFTKPGGGTRIGDRVASSIVTLRSDPANPLHPTSTFDEEGYPIRPTSWIEQGVLRNLIVSRYWAAKTKRAPLAEPRSYALSGGTATSLDELIKGVDRGLLVTRFWYVRMLDPKQILCTGLTRDGVFLIEKGAVTRPVSNFRFNESPLGMLARADAMTAATTRPPTGDRLSVPAVRSGEFNMASRSEAV